LEINLIDILNFAIKDDKYYLTHQLHSNPRDTKKIFQKEKTGTRRSIETLIDMKKKGRQRYGLTGKDYRKNMQKMTDDPNVWYERYFAEDERTLYDNSPDVDVKIRKEILKKAKLKPGTPNYEQKKKILDAGKEVFPDIPLAVILESLDNKTQEKMRKIGKESGIDFDLIMELIRKGKTFEGIRKLVRKQSKNSKDKTKQKKQPQRKRNSKTQKQKTKEKKKPVKK